jgi:hypothetical protein
VNGIPTALRREGDAGSARSSLVMVRFYSGDVRG